MQRSFNGGYNSGGGGGMIRTVQRVIRSRVGGAPTEPITTTNTVTTSSTLDSRKSKNFNTGSSPPNTPLTLSSSSSTTNVRERFPYAVINDVSAHVHAADDINTEWECVEGLSYYGNQNYNYNNDEDVVCNEDYHHVFGTVPSRDEVVHAVSALQQFLEASSPYTRSPKRKLDEETDNDARHEVTGSMERISSNEYNEIEDWIEPSLNLCSSRTSLQPPGTERVYDAFHLLQNEPSIQRMVVSLSSDKAVWDAVLDNEVVKELRSSITQANKGTEENSDKGSGDDSNPIRDMIGWLIANTRTRITQLINNITKLVNGIFQAPNEGKRQDNAHPLEEKLKTSLMLSVVVLLIVVITRAIKSA